MAMQIRFGGGSSTQTKKPATPGQQMAMGIVFGLIGLGMLVGGGFWCLSTKKFVSGASKAWGDVVRLESSRSSSDDAPSYYPVVSYRTAEGEVVEFRSKSGSNPPSHSEGDKVEVLYDPNRPEKAEINSFVSLWLGPIVLGALGLVFSIVGPLAFVRGKRMKQAAASTPSPTAPPPPPPPTPLPTA